VCLLAQTEPSALNIPRTGIDFRLRGRPLSWPTDICLFVWNTFGQSKISRPVDYMPFTYNICNSFRFGSRSRRSPHAHHDTSTDGSQLVSLILSRFSLPALLYSLFCSRPRSPRPRDSSPIMSVPFPLFRHFHCSRAFPRLQKTSILHISENGDSASEDHPKNNPPPPEPPRQPLSASSMKESDLPPSIRENEYESGRVICEVCEEGVSIRDEETGGFSISKWTAHRKSW